MSTNLDTLLEAIQQSYSDAPNLAGYDLVLFSETQQGSGVCVFEKRDENGVITDYIVAMRGTEDAVDVYSDLNLGWDQWQAIESDLASIFANAISQGIDISFVGHSLGGALAQYAAYDYALDAKGIQSAGDFNIVTVNSLGAEAALRANLTDPFDPSLVPSATAQHFYVEGDFVSRLGGGHLGGPTIQISDPSSTGEALDPITAHRMTTALALYNSGQFAAGTMVSPDYLSTSGVQQLAFGLASIFNGEEISSAEANARIIAGIAGALSMAALAPSSIPANELNELVQELFEAYASSVAPDSNTQMALEFGASMDWATFLSANSVSPVGAALLGLTVTGIVAASLGDAIEASSQSLTDALVILDEQYGIELDPNNVSDTLTGFIDDWNLPGSMLMERLVGLFSDVVSVAANDITMDEGGTGTLQLSRSGGDIDEAVSVLVRISDSSVASLQVGANVVWDADVNGYRVTFNAGQATLDIRVNATADADAASEHVTLSILEGPWADMFPDVFETSLASVNVAIGDTPTPDTVIDEPGNLIGTGGSDEIVGTDGDDDIDGVAGDDLIYAGAGDDFVIVENGDSTIFAGDGADFVGARGTGNDSIDGELKDDFLQGGQGSDTVAGGDGVDFVNGSDGSDFLEGGAGNDILYGDGTFYAMNDNWTVTVTDDGSTFIPTVSTTNIVGLHDAGEYSDDDFIVGGIGDDLIVGGGGNDTIVAGAETLTVGDTDADAVVGHDGNDYIEGGAGDDRITGDYAADLTISGNDTIWAGDGDDQVKGGLADDHIYGEDGDDVLVGDYQAYPGIGGADYIDGGDGEDQLQGGFGDDVLHGGKLRDLMWGGAGADMLYGDEGDDQLVGDDGKDSLSGGDGEDLLVGGIDDDFLDGGADADQLQGGDGKDLLAGGGNNDTLFGQKGNDDLFGDAGDDYLVAGVGDDYLDGGLGADELQGGDGNDLLAGGDRIDILFGQGGHDDLLGGTGDDQIVGGAGNDLASGGAGDDALWGDAGADIMTGGFGEDVLEGGADDDSLSGGGEVDQIFGDSGADTIAGGDGADWLEGNDGDDSLSGGDDADVMLGGIGIDSLFGDDGEDELQGGDNDDLLDGGFGSDYVYGDAGNDDLYGGDGWDLLYGNGGDDFIAGESGADIVYGDIGNDDLYGGDGYDELYGQANDDVIEGNADNDDIDGGAGSDLLYGGSGQDGILGGDGADLLHGGSGSDGLNGGAGDDTYMFNQGDGRDAIFEQGDTLNDVLNFGQGIDPNDVAIQLVNGTLLMIIGDGSDQVALVNWSVTNGQQHVAEVTFADGTIWDRDYLNAAVSDPTVAPQTEPVMLEPGLDMNKRLSLLLQAEAGFGVDAGMSDVREYRHMQEVHSNFLATSAVTRHVDYMVR